MHETAIVHLRPIFWIDSVGRNSDEAVNPAYNAVKLAVPKPSLNRIYTRQHWNSFTTNENWDTRLKKVLKLFHCR